MELYNDRVEKYIRCNKDFDYCKQDKYDEEDMYNLIDYLNEYNYFLLQFYEVNHHN